CFFFSSRRRHTRFSRDWSSDVCSSDLARAIAAHGPRLALVLWPGIQYRTGQAFDLARIAALAHAQGARAGFDLAHAAGNLPLALHDAGADFAVWCDYKYVNAGPGAVAGCFVHQRHGNAGLPRMAGWWGHEASTRFRMAPEFVPAAGAEGWQLSNPPVLAMAPLRASLEQFERAGGMAALRAKSERLTGLLERLIHERLADTLQVVTPADPQRRGCQLSLRVTGGRERGRALFEHLRERGFLGDWREPDVIRIAPVPLSNRYAEVLALVEEVERGRSACPRGPAPHPARRVGAAHAARGCTGIPPLGQQRFPLPDPDRRRPGRLPAGDPALAARLEGHHLRAPRRPADQGLRIRPLDQPGPGRARPPRPARGRGRGSGDAPGGDDARAHGARAGRQHHAAALRPRRLGGDLVGAPRRPQHDPAAGGRARRGQHPLPPPPAHGGFRRRLRAPDRRPRRPAARHPLPGTDWCRRR